MPEPTEYSRPGYLIYAGSALTETSEISLKGASQDKLVETLLKGASGHSDGSTKVDVTQKSAVPKAGLEGDLLQAWLQKRTVTLKFRIANLIVTVQGRITNITLSTSVNNPNSFDVDFEGYKPTIQTVG
jgi:hypothetical protein